MADAVQPHAEAIARVRAAPARRQHRTPAWKRRATSATPSYQTPDLDERGRAADSG
jgi:hypothetical protein